MPKENYLRIFSRRAKDCHTYKEGPEMLKLLNNSMEKQNRLLKEWRHMRISEKMEETPESSEISVYSEIVARIMSVQEHIDESTRGDKFLWDQLLASIEFPRVQSSLKDKIPRSSQKLINAIANYLSEKPRSARIEIEGMESGIPNQWGYRSTDEAAMYTLSRIKW